MADTRRADPQYQFDIDKMILEYTLHNAIKVHLGAVGSFCRLDHLEPSQASDLVEIDTEEANRLAEIFDGEYAPCHFMLVSKSQCSLDEALSYSSSRLYFCRRPFVQHSNLAIPVTPIAVGWSFRMGCKSYEYSHGGGGAAVTRAAHC